MTRIDKSKSRLDHVVTELRRRLMHYLPGSRLPGYRQLAGLTHATEQTVKSALAQLAGEGIVALHERQGTIVLQQPRRMPISRIRVLNTHTPKELFSETVLAGVSKRCDRYGLKMAVDREPGDLNAPETLRRLAGEDPQLAGWVLVLLEPLPDATLLAWQAKGIPFVVVDDFPGVAQVNLVGRDMRRAIYEATDKLLELGHRRVALVGLHAETHRQSQQRLAGFQLAHEHHGLQVDPSLMVYGNPSKRLPSRQDLQRLLARPDRPTALVGVDQPIGCTIIAACRQAGLNVPGQVSVISAGLRPRLEPDLLNQLTRFDEGSPERLGELAVDILADHHNHPETTTTFWLGSVYVDCGSVAGVPGPSGPRG
ncbi:MAG: HTH-type transcriptional repressor PurR [Phycisphaerae bacterium]|nr:HTH-type transcriptional repressor PurR [Phycisphaerae bacterium]